MLDVNIY